MKRSGLCVISARCRFTAAGLEHHLELVKDVEGHVEVVVLDADIHEAGVGVNVAVDAPLAHLPEQLHRIVHLTQPAAQRDGCVCMLSELSG